MLELDDIQHILVTRTPALTGRYEFLTFRDTAGAQAWLAGILEKIRSASSVRSTVESDNRWVNVAFTWEGLRALGVDEASLATFPEEFKQGMVARAEMLGDTGVNHPELLGGRPGQSRPARHCDPLRPHGVGAHPGAWPPMRSCSRSSRSGTALLSGPRGHPALRLCPRPLRLPRPSLPAGDEGNRGGANPRLRRSARAGRVHPGLSR